VTFTLDGSASMAARWVSVALPKEFHFNAPVPPANGRYWIVLHSLDGQAAWNGIASAASQPTVQHTLNGGASLRAAPLSVRSAAPANVAALYRLRFKPDRFSVPIELQVGGGTTATRVKLDRFQPLGRVDFSLDVPEVADGFNRYLAATAQPCSQAELLANGDSAQWSVVGTELNSTVTVQNGNCTGALCVSPDSRFAFVGVAGKLERIDTLSNVAESSIGFPGNTARPSLGVMSPDGTRIYAFAAPNLFIIDTISGTSIGPANVGPATDAVVALGGASLCVATANGVVAFDVTSLEAAIRSGGKATPSKTSSFGTAVSQIAVSADGGLIFAATDDGPAKSALLTLDAATLESRGATLNTGAIAGLAATPDGNTVVVADATARALLLVDLARAGSPTSVSLPGYRWQSRYPETARAPISWSSSKRRKVPPSLPSILRPFAPSVYHICCPRVQALPRHPRSPSLLLRSGSLSCRSEIASMYGTITR
jgi:hypothetical protein